LRAARTSTFLENFLVVVAQYGKAQTPKMTAPPGLGGDKGFGDKGFGKGLPGGPAGMGMGMAHPYGW